MRIVTDVPPCAEAAAAVRALASTFLEAWGRAAGLEDSVLVLNELFLNVVQHAPGQDHVAVEVEIRGSGVRMCLTDGSAEPPVLRAPSATADNGRGLRIVDSLTSRWGYDPYPGGKMVWAEVDVP